MLLCVQGRLQTLVVSQAVGLWSNARYPLFAEISPFHVFGLFQNSVVRLPEGNLILGIIWIAKNGEDSMGQWVAVSEIQALVDHSTLGVPADLHTHRDWAKPSAGPPLFSSCWNAKSGE